MFLENVAIEWVAFRGHTEALREAIEALRQWRNETDQHVIQYRQQQAFHHIVRYWREQEMLWVSRQAAAKGEIFAKLHAGDLELLRAEDPHAAPKPVHLGFVHQFQNLDELIRALGGPRIPPWTRIIIFDPNPPKSGPPLLVDEARLHKLWPAASEEDVRRLARDTKIGADRIYEKLGGIISRPLVREIVRKVRTRRPVKSRR